MGQIYGSTPPKAPFFLTGKRECDNICPFGGRGVVVNMRPCQGRDRGFESRRSRHEYPKKAA